MILKTSPDWPGAKAWLQLQIELFRVELEGGECAIKRADHLRGKIMFAREIIASVEPKDIPPPSEAPARDRGVNY